MAELKSCLDLVIDSEGGYKLHEIPGDRGGMTFAGISRNFWPNWEGWKKIDEGEIDEELIQMVHDFYHKEFWSVMKGDEIIDQEVAYILFDFGMNAGMKNAIKLAQEILKVAADGIFGPITLKALNDYCTEPSELIIFVLQFSLGRIYYYKDISWKDERRKNDIIKSNMKFLPGWMNRVQDTLENLEKL